MSLDTDPLKSPSVHHQHPVTIPIPVESSTELEGASTGVSESEASAKSRQDWSHSSESDRDSGPVNFTISQGLVAQDRRSGSTASLASGASLNRETVLPEHGISHPSSGVAELVRHYSGLSVRSDLSEVTGISRVGPIPSDTSGEINWTMRLERLRLESEGKNSHME